MPRSFAGLPIIELILDIPGFAPGYFMTAGAHFASADLRAVLALPGDVVEYLPVDMGRCRPDAIARKYRLMNARLTRELIDLDRTAHDIGPVKRSDGTEHDLVMLDPEARQYWRENFVADVRLFRAAHSTALIVDDAVASRVLAAGLSAMVFQDITSDPAQERMVLRIRDRNAV